MSNEVWVLVDTETDGLRQPIHAVEIAAQRFEGISPVGAPFRVFLDHKIAIPYDAFSVHGYDAAFLAANGVEPVEAYRGFWEYVNGAKVAAHYAGFDWRRVLIPESQRLGVSVNGEYGFCTWALARRSLPEHFTWRLDHLRTEYKMEGPRAHSAFGDVEITGKLITQVIAPKLQHVGLMSVPEMAVFSRLPVRLCHAVIRAGKFSSLDEALDVVGKQEQERDARAKRVGKILEANLTRLDQCNAESELRGLAIEMGFLVDDASVQFSGKKFMFTGTLAVGKRRFAAQAVIVRGGYVDTKAQPIRDPDYLVLGDARAGGGKLRCYIGERMRGSSLPVIICEQQFLAGLAESAESVSIS